MTKTFEERAREWLAQAPESPIFSWSDAVLQFARFLDSQPQQEAPEKCGVEIIMPTPGSSSPLRLPCGNPKPCQDHEPEKVEELPSTGGFGTVTEKLNEVIRTLNTLLKK